MKNLLSILALVIFIPSIFISSCKKERDEDIIPPINPTTYNISVSGTVVDISMSPLQNVSVKIGTKEVITEADGSFYFSNVTVPKNRFLVEFSKTGYFTLSRSAIPENNGSIDIEIGLISETDLTYAGSASFISSSAYTFTMSNTDCEITFPDNAFVTSSNTAYTGNVNVKAVYLAPNMQNYPMFVFGGDLYGKDSLGNDVTLNPYSGLNVLIKDDNGNILKLDSSNNKKATVSIKIPIPLVASAPATIELMEYNQTDGICYASGTATKSGDKYMGQVGHFSYWSCQKTHVGKATITGSVTDINGNPVAGVRVCFGRVIGISDIIAITDANGNYSKIIPAGVSGIVGIFPSYYGTLVPTVDIPILNDGDTHIANIIIPTSIRKVTGKLLKCSNIPIKGGKIILTWYSSTSGTYVHSTCFSRIDGTFNLSMELYVYSATIHAWGNNMDTLISNIYFSQTDTIKDIGDIILCPPIQTGPTHFTLTGGQFISPTIFSSFNNNKEGYLQYDTAGTPKHIVMQGYGTDGDIWISVNGISTGIYPIGVKSATMVSIYIMNINPPFQSELNNGSVKITRFDPIGGLIEGSYSGTTASGVSLTNGTFSVIRTANRYN